MINIATYRSEPEDVSRPIYFDLALLGYTTELSREGLKQLAENNKEQVCKLFIGFCIWDNSYYPNSTRKRL